MSEFEGGASAAPVTEGGQGGTEQAPAGEPTGGGATPAAPGTAETGQGQGQGAPATTTPKAVDEKQYRELHGKFTRTSQENALLRQRIQRMEAGTGAKPQAKGGITLDKEFADVLGPDLAGKLQGILSTVAGASDHAAQNLTRQMEVANFYSNFPDMREHQSEIEALEFQLNDQNSPLRPIHVMGLAVRGMHMNEIVEAAVTSARAKWEKEERPKILAGIGPGTGISPSESPTEKEEKSRVAEAIFGVKNPKFSIPQ